MLYSDLINLITRTRDMQNKQKDQIFLSARWIQTIIVPMFKRMRYSIQVLSIAVTYLQSNVIVIHYITQTR